MQAAWNQPRIETNSFSSTQWIAYDFHVNIIIPAVYHIIVRLSIYVLGIMLGLSTLTIANAHTPFAQSHMAYVQLSSVKHCMVKSPACMPAHYLT